MSYPDLAGKAAIVTGAGAGIGLAIAYRLAAEGCRVLCADIDGDSAKAAAAGIGGAAVAQRVDISDEQQVIDMVEACAEAFGGVDKLVANAGVVHFASVLDTTVADFDRVLAINLKGTFLCCQAVIPAMRRQRHGRILNLGSVIGKNGGNPRPWIDPGEQARASNVAYGASKAGVHALTFFLARELAADGITVNAIAPGPIATAMTKDLPATLKALIPVGRMGRGEDVAEAALYLASDAAGFVTGEVLDVNGGMWAD